LFLPKILPKDWLIIGVKSDWRRPLLPGKF
jgi:hypothetical protein